MTHTPRKSSQSLSAYLFRKTKALMRCINNKYRKTFGIPINCKYHETLDIPIIYKYRNFDILLPTDHQLPNYQQTFPKYDRFLPHLVTYLTLPSTVIDIGANVGDTLAGMIDQNPSLHYLCIEPDDNFFDYLLKNTKRIKKRIKDANISTIKALVGKDVTSATLEGKGGTKHAVLGKGNGIPSEPLDILLSDKNSLNIRLLKTDVDGFDYDVLFSSVSIIKSHKPIIFFECQYDFDFQKDGYEQLIKLLKEEGYEDWTLFDNFGEVVLRTKNVNSIKNLMDYIWKQNTGVATRTIYYFDILATHSKDSALIDKILIEYS